MNFFVRVYSAVFAFVLIVGETLVVVSMEKFWPLTLDDYLAALALLFAVWLSQSKPHQLMPVIWAFVCGSLYATLFSRLDPLNGSGERVVLVIVALLAAIAGMIISIIARRRNS